MLSDIDIQQKRALVVLVIIIILEKPAKAWCTFWPILQCKDTQKMT